MITADDSTALHVLKTIAQTRLKPASDESSANTQLDSSTFSSPQLRAALAAAFGDSRQTASSEADLARAALDVLAQDPAYAEPIQVMASQGASGRPKRYLDPTGIALTAAALLVLQTRIKFKRDHTGKWSIEVDKKSASDSAVKLLVQRLLSYLPK